MKAVKGCGLFIILFIIAAVMASPVLSGLSSAETGPYKKEDCVKCHPGPVNDIQTAGRRHQNVPCLGCHVGHPPEVKKPIEPCSKCHQSSRRKVHFESENCLRCHMNPHKPLNMNLAGNDVCLTCHTKQAAQLKDNQSKHSALGCAACHPVHRLIPKCAQCHTGKAHFEIEGCTRCHKPHMPLNLSFTGPVADVCATCHTKQAAQLKDNQSKHSAFDCSFCHTAHRQVPQCLQCHKPHSAETAVADCKKCHKAHMPKLVTYDSDTPSESCGICHRKEFDLLSASAAKHKTLICAFCHQERHKMLPNCEDCHGSRHPFGIMVKFPKCGECHGIAHDLNNWPPAQKGEAQTETEKKN